MKIVFVTNKFPPLNDGVGDYSYFLAKKICDLNHQVTIICQEKKTIKTKFLNAKSFQIKVRSEVKCWNRLGINKVLTIIKEEEPDCIILQYVPYAFHSRGTPFCLIQLCKAIKSQKNIQLGVFFHEVQIKWPGWHVKYWPIAIAQRLIAAKLCYLADKVATSIPYYAQYLQTWRKQVDVIPVGANIPIVNFSKQDRQDLRKKLFGDNSVFIIVSFGKRQHDWLLNLFEQLASEIKQLRLLIIGSPNLSFPVSSKISDKVLFTNYLEGTIVFKYLSSSDLFIQLNSSDGKGGVNHKSGALAAAFAAGLPICGSIGYLTNFEPFPYAKVQLFKSEEEARNIVKMIFHSSKKQKELAHFSNLHFNSTISWEVIANRYIELLKPERHE